MGHMKVLMTKREIEIEVLTKLQEIEDILVELPDFSEEIVSLSISPRYITCWQNVSKNNNSKTIDMCFAREMNKFI